MNEAPVACDRALHLPTPQLGILQARDINPDASLRRGGSGCSLFASLKVISAYSMAYVLSLAESTVMTPDGLSFQEFQEAGTRQG